MAFARAARFWASRDPHSPSILAAMSSSKYSPLDHQTATAPGRSSAAAWAARASAVFTTVFVATSFAFAVLYSGENASKLALGSWAAGSKGRPAPALHPKRQMDVTMSNAECRAEFPLLFDQLDANVKTWTARGGVTEDDLEQSITSCQIGCVRMLIQDGRIFIRNYSQGMQSRIRGIMSIFKTAVEAADDKDKESFEGIELVFNAFDKNGFRAGRGSGWVLTKLASDAPGQFLLRECGMRQSGGT